MSGPGERLKNCNLGTKASFGNAMIKKVINIKMPDTRRGEWCWFRHSRAQPVTHTYTRA